MPFFRIPGIGTVHVGMAKSRPKECSARNAVNIKCGLTAHYQCDWPLASGRTCDRHLCRRHALEVAEDRHYCPQHAHLHAERLNAPELPL